MGDSMKKIAFMFLLLFVFAFPLFAGENQDSNQTKKQIVVAFSNSNECKDDCRSIFDNCQRICQGYSNASFCVGGCADEYAWCLKDCEKKYPNK
jgi:hypothetical protein